MPNGVRVRCLAPDKGMPVAPIAHALRSGAGRALDFLQAPPRDREGWLRWLECVVRDAPRLPADVGSAVVARQRSWGAGPRALAHAEALSKGEALAVITGQQPGLLGGPLLTFHKAAGAISLARQLSALGGPPVVPVFWIASEDHDFDEANRAGVIDTAHALRLLRVEGSADGRSLAHYHVKPEAMAALHTTLAEVLPDTERAAAARTLVAGDPTAPWHAQCAQALLQQLGDSGIVILEPFDLLPAMGETLSWLVQHGLAIHDTVRETGTRLRAAGLPAPVEPQPGTLPLFVREAPGAPRRRVAWAGPQEAHPEDPQATRAQVDLARRLVAEPLLGSGDVIGRVFVQNAALPGVAYIAGPSEIAYQAQVRAAAERLGTWFPLALPRPTATFTDAKARDTLAQFGQGLRPALGAPLGRPPGADDATCPGAELLAAVDAHLAAWPQRLTAEQALAGRGPAALTRALERLQRAWAKQRAQVEAAYRADAGRDRGRWERARTLLWPRGRPQERVLAPVGLAARHGIGPLREAWDALDPLRSCHYVIDLP